jgi:phosphatidylglycerol:prolipoprotein diacylglycerol transferase
MNNHHTLALIPYTFHSFGVFMVLAFGGAYFIFRSEYKRKEALGQISAFRTQIRNHGDQGTITGILIGFFVGFKSMFFWQNPGIFEGGMAQILFSANGSMIGGTLGAILVCAGTILYQKMGQKKSKSTSVLIHPYQLMDTVLLYCGLFGFIGAVLFAKLDDTTGLLTHPFTYNGLSYYGALIFGALTFLVINYRAGIGVLTAVDIGSPGMMLAYAIGRMGCHISGDGDWGIVNLSAPPSWLSWLPDWAWAYRYPHNVLRQGTYIPGCVGDYCNELLRPVYPTSLYESLICLVLFGVLWAIRRRILTPGLLFCVYALLNGTERFLMEFIKINPHYTLFGLSLSQAQWIALGWLLAGVVGLGVILRSLGHSRDAGLRQ